ncbi:hypothetical protein ACJIZ3_022444 [Penstemon smallii]|uniref:Uncharacterized protein n=1 Tax=Penstemon smallii TaxID=265156 RepID=A0ABD3TNG6_9LAMI
MPRKRLRESNGALSCATSPVNAKRLKVDITPVQSGPLSIKTNQGQSEWYIAENPKHSEVANYVVAIPAVPVKMVPPTNFNFEPERLLASPDKVNNNENLLRNIDSLMAEAQEFINVFDIKYSDSKKKEVETKAEDKSMKSKGEDDNASTIQSKAEPGKISNLVESQKIESAHKKEQDDSMGNFKIDGCIDIESKDEPNNYHNQMELINMSIVQQDQPHAIRVREALNLFEDQYFKIMQKSDKKGDGKCVTYAYLEAAKRVKLEGMWIFPEKPFGHIPGIEIGKEFRFRAELAIVGLHRQLVSGIDYVVLDGKQFATSVVNSDPCENKAKTLDVIIYSGQGGVSKVGKKVVDQKLEKGNLALVNSMEMGYPVRVTHKRKSLDPPNTLGMNNKKNIAYTYDGLYIVKKYWKERGQNKKLVFKFELHKMDEQPGLHQSFGKSRTLRERKEVCVLDDVSNGKENVKIRAMNGVDCDKPLSFIYTSKIIYPDWFHPIEPIGCNCINGCSDSQKCPCVMKNRGEIPFNERGAIVRAKPLVHECGPLCKCPPNCMNRVSQRGPQCQLEIFKTKSRGWGLRSRNSISPGDFICEYIGELLQEKEAEQRIGQDEYLFDISDDRFAIDAATYGNIGRFINHSCSPNLYAQEVLYDHDDKRMPHIMFFATKKIPPLCELTYDYNYKIGRVCDVNGNIKTKDCRCGSRQCIGRLY